MSIGVDRAARSGDAPSSRALLSILGAVCLSATSASAAPPTKAECVAANETGQDLRRSGKLREARTSLAACLAASCPGAVREDCAQRLAEVDQAVPTLVFVATDGAGRDLSAVRVFIDGQPLLDVLDGKAWPVDPGEHRVRFETEGVPAKDESVLVSEGEKNRRIRVVLAPPPAPSKPPAAAPSSAGLGAQRTIGIGLGIGGVASAAVGAVFGLVAKATQESAVSQCRDGDPNDCSLQSVNRSQTAHDEAAVSTVAFVAGGALLAVGIVVYFTAPGSERVTVGLAVGNRAIGLRGTW